MQNILGVTKVNPCFMREILPISLRMIGYRAIITHKEGKLQVLSPIGKKVLAEFSEPTMDRDIADFLYKITTTRGRLTCR